MSLPSGKHRLLYAIFHFITKWRKFGNPRNLKITADAEFIGWFIFSGANSAAEKHVKFALCKLADYMCAFSRTN